MGSGRGGLAAVCCVLLIGLITLGLSIAEIVIGAKYLHQCPAERLIPIYLIVSGCVGIILAFGSGSDAKDTHSRQRQGDEQVDGESQGLQGTREQSSGAQCCNCIRGLISLFAFVWMCIGMYWVLHINTTVTASDPAASTYCNPTLYTFALVMVFIRLGILILIGAISICVCCGIVCCAALFG